MSDLDLSKQRQQIDDIDEQIVKALGRRFEVIKEVKALKKQKNVTVRDKQREKKLLDRLSQLAEQQNLDPMFIKDLYEKILEESRRAQK